MSGSISVDTDEIEDVHVPNLINLADEYEDLLHMISAVTRDRANLFDVRNRSSLRDGFLTSYDLFYAVLHQTGVNLRTTAGLLKQVAEDHVINEGEIADSFEHHQNEVAGLADDSWSRSESEYVDEDSPEAAPDPDQKDHGWTEYDDELNPKNSYPG